MLGGGSAEQPASPGCGCTICDTHMRLSWYRPEFPCPPSGPCWVIPRRRVRLDMPTCLTTRCGRQSSGSAGSLHPAVPPRSCPCPVGGSNRIQKNFLACRYKVFDPLL